VKTIAISQRVEIDTGRNERSDILDHRLSGFVITAGYLPLPVPNMLGAGVSQTCAAWLAATKPDAILLSGGGDLGSHPERDRTEICLLEYAQTNGLPVLGICRGMQFLGVRAGGVLKAVSDHVARQHRLEGEIAGCVNSYHRFSLADCPPDYRVLARCADGEIEAIAHRDLAWEGWMWHPERDHPYQDIFIQRLRALFR
jgi:gamma-glutamyl-gamma-aminobutyrate hydrolase PuuD